MSRINLILSRVEHEKSFFNFLIPNSCTQLGFGITSTFLGVNVSMLKDNTPKVGIEPCQRVSNLDENPEDRFSRYNWSSKSSKQL